MQGRYPEIGKAIRAARLRKGWSQERAAREVGTSRFQWIRWEQGLHRPTEYRAALVEKLGLDSKVLDDEEESVSDLLRRLAAKLDRGAALPLAALTLLGAWGLGAVPSFFSGGL